MAQLDETAYQQLLQALAAHHTGGDQGSCDGELQLTLQGIFDARNRSLIPGPSSFAPYDPRQFAVGPDRQTRFYFKVENQTARVALQITAGPENETARAFYRDQPLVLFLEEAVAPGEHWFSWDGTISELRTQSGGAGRRLILQGQYQVTLLAFCNSCDLVLERKATIEVRRPEAFAYGPYFPSEDEKFKQPYDLRGAADTFTAAMETLPDGSGFDATARCNIGSHAALYDMRDSAALWFYNGHGFIGEISFYNWVELPAGSSEGEKPWQTFLFDYLPAHLPEHMLKKQVAVIEPPLVPDGALEDLFLVVLLTCWGASGSDDTPGLARSLARRGVDHVVAFSGETDTYRYLQWTTLFSGYLEQGQGIETAARSASEDANRDPKHEFKVEVFAADGVDANEKLFPARYGRRP